MRCKKLIFGGITFGLFLGILFPPIFGGIWGDSFFADIYNVLIFPLHLFGHLFLWISGKAIGNVPYGILLLLLTMPITYGFLAWLLCLFLQSKRKRGSDNRK